MLTLISYLYCHLMVLVLICLVAVTHRYYHTRWANPLPVILPSRAWPAFLILVGCVCFFFPFISFPFLSFIIYQFLLHILFSSFSLFPAFHIGSFSAHPVLLSSSYSVLLNPSSFSFSQVLWSSGCTW